MGNVLVVGIAIGALIIGLVLGLGFRSSQPKTAQETRESSQEYARPSDPLTAEIRMVVGTLTSIENSGLRVALEKPQNVVGDFPLAREVIVTADTVIIRQKSRDRAEFDRDVAAYQEILREAVRAVKPGQSPPPAP